MKHLDGLVEFFAVVEQGGFTAAAKELNVSTSYISRSVSKLEDRLNSRLLHRTTRRVQLTDLGTQYYEGIGSILGDITNLESTIAEQQNLLVGNIRVTAGGLYGETTISSALATFAREHPKISLHLEISNRNFDLINEGYDLAIRHGVPSDPDLIAREVSTRNIKICAAPELLATSAPIRTPHDLSNTPCICTPDIPWMFSDGSKQFTVRVQSAWTSNSVPAMTAAVLQGLGFARLPETYVRQHLLDGTLVAVLSEYEMPPQPTYLVYPSKELMPYRMRRLIDFLVDHLR